MYERGFTKLFHHRTANISVVRPCSDSPQTNCIPIYYEFSIVDLHIVTAHVSCPTVTLAAGICMALLHNHCKGY